MGAVISPTVDPMLVMEYMEYGSLYDLLHNETMSAGGEIILQVARDIIQGIQFLHASKPPILHGDLKAKNILVDSRFRAKVADFGFSHFKTSTKKNVLQGTPFFIAPEYLRRRSEYTAACDIYSLGMILYEIYAREGPFEGEDPRKILPKVCHPRINKRPKVPDAMPPKMVEIMKKCWSANPFFRPTAKDMDYAMVEMNSKDTEPLLTGHDTFKDKIKRKPTSLYDVFPKHIADALNSGKKVEAESHEIVTVVFSDIVGFTTISQTFSPLKVSNMLDRLYQAFDELAGKHKVFKVETIGDAYMGVTNLDGSEFDTHVKQIAMFAQDAIHAASQILIDDEDPSRGCVNIRVGFHSGPVVSNVIGSLNPRYGLFGDTVNTASRMESNSVAGKIHCTSASAQLLAQQAPDIEIKLRGMIRVKGKGKMRTYWVGAGEAPVEQPLDESENPGEESGHPGGDEDEHEGSEGHHSQHTEDTHPMSLADHDHYIDVHASDKKRSHRSHVGMDGSVSDSVNSKHMLEP
jgi:serine/threonine protein kinase